jgi:hypothetical protein
MYGEKGSSGTGFPGMLKFKPAIIIPAMLNIRAFVHH